LISFYKAFKIRFLSLIKSLNLLFFFYYIITLAFAFSTLANYSFNS
jgi:hypothetical protein